MKQFITLLIALLVLLTQPLAAFASYFPETAIKTSTKSTYMGSSAFVTPAGSTTDIFQIYGSSTKTVKILKVSIASTSTSAIQNTPDQVFLVKRSTANSAGTAGTTTVTPVDSNNASATATIKVYTANPTLGTLVGQLKALGLLAQYTSTGGTGATTPEHVIFDALLTGQPIVLRGTGEGLCINYNGVAPGGTSQKLAFNIIWTEE